jgi:hypothetical protein
MAESSRVSLKAKPDCKHYLNAFEAVSINALEIKNLRL